MKKFDGPNASGTDFYRKMIILESVKKILEPTNFKSISFGNNKFWNRIDSKIKNNSECKIWDI